MDFRGNFFGSLVEISSLNLNILIIMAFYYILLIGISVQKLWFGPLRTVEVAHLYERSWFAVMVFTLFYPRILVWP
jgi:E3 ubiquitin-protein ligase synoviolin